MTNPVWQHLHALNSFSYDFATALGTYTGGSTPSSSGFPASNDAIFVPCYVKQSVLIKRLFVTNGGSVSGNVDVGIYAQDGTRVASSGSVAQSGLTQPQFFDITDLVIGPGAYYLALAADSTSGTFFRSNTSIARLQALGVAKQASAFPLPASATFATVTALFLPLMGAEITELK